MNSQVICVFNLFHFAFSNLIPKLHKEKGCNACKNGLTAAFITKQYYLRISVYRFLTRNCSMLENSGSWLDAARGVNVMPYEDR